MSEQAKALYYGIGIHSNPALAIELIDQALARARAEGFSQGYICAVATLVNAHGHDTIADELLRAHGKVDWSIIDLYDQRILHAADLAPKPKKQQAQDAGKA